MSACRSPESNAYSLTVLAAGSWTRKYMTQSFRITVVSGCTEYPLMCEGKPGLRYPVSISSIPICSTSSQLIYDLYRQDILRSIQAFSCFPFQWAVIRSFSANSDIIIAEIQYGVGFVRFVIHGNTPLFKSLYCCPRQTDFFFNQPDIRIFCSAFKAQ